MKIKISQSTRKVPKDTLTGGMTPGEGECYSYSEPGSLWICCSYDCVGNTCIAACLIFEWPVPNVPDPTPTVIKAAVAAVDRAGRAADRELRARGKRLMVPFDAEERALVDKHLRVTGPTRTIADIIRDFRFGGARGIDTTITI